MLGLSTAVFTLVSKKNTFSPLHEQFLTFFEVGLHFLEVGLLGSGLGAVEGLHKFKIELVLVFVRFSFKLERFLKFQFLDLFHRQFCRSIVSTLNLTCSVIEQLLKGGY